jgi:agmatinase
MKDAGNDMENIAGSFDNFLSLPPEYSEKDAPAFRVFTAPFERTTSYRRGAARGPRELISASHQVELFDFEIRQSAFERGIATDRSLEQYCGGGYEEFDAPAREAVSRSLARGEVPVLLGGEHTVSLAGVAAALEKYPDLTVVQIDAHADLRENYDGDPHSHACVMRRILELGGGAAKLVQVGIRSLCTQELKTAESEDRIRMFPAKPILRSEISFDDIMSSVEGHVYLTVDLDGFDPSEVPGVGTPEPGGLSWRWAAEFLERLCGAAQVDAFDIVELCPVSGGNSSEYFAAKLTYRIMGLISGAGRGRRK